MITISPIFLSRWSDVIGPLIELHEQDGQLLATVGAVIVVLPVEHREKLERLVGQKIGILHTDFDYRIKILRGEYA